MKNVFEYLIYMSKYVSARVFFFTELPPIPVNFTIFPWSSVNTDDGDHIEYKIQWETKYVPEYITSYLIQARQHYNDYFHHYHYPQSEWYELLADIYSQTNDKTTGNIR